MRFFLVAIVLSMSFTGIGQEKVGLDSTTPEECITSFFKAFHAQDTSSLKSIIHEDVVLATIKSNKEDTILVVDDINKFYTSISSIPEEMNFHEEITSIEVKTDGILAQVWTEYIFHVNGEVSHQGVNAFTLINVNGMWSVIYLVDTRRKE